MYRAGTERQEELAVEHSERPEYPDDHKRFSLNEDWAATIVGLVLFLACLLGLLTPELIP